VKEGAREQARLYESLARYHWLRRRLARAAPGEGLEMHKRLRAADASGGAEGTLAVDAWLDTVLEPAPEPRVLDVGCGFGATLIKRARRARGGRFVGVCTSPFQVRMATREAQRLGLGERCSFAAQSYDDPITGPFDLVLSVEALFHAPDLHATLRRLAGLLVEGGSLALVEDMAMEEKLDETADGRELLARWATQRLHAVGEYRRALEEAGLRLRSDVDFTDRVERRPAAEIDASASRLASVRRFLPLPAGRRVVDAFLGGFALERLYAAGHMSYRGMLAVREAGAA
jgi:SAM-dependent methyltransferase